MRRWVWNAYSIIILTDNCGCGVMYHCGMSRGHCCILGTTLSRAFRQLTTPLTCEFCWKCHAQSDVEIVITQFFWKKKKKNWGIHGCILLYPIRVVTTHAITDHYWHFIYLIQTHILALKRFNIQRLQVGPIDFASSLMHMSWCYVLCQHPYGCYRSLPHSLSATHCRPRVLSDLFLGQWHHLPELLPLGLHLIYWWPWTANHDYSRRFSPF